MERLKITLPKTIELGRRLAKKKKLIFLQNKPLTRQQPSVHEDIVNKNKLTDAKKVRINQENYHNLNTSVVPELQNTFRRSILGRYSKCKNLNMPTNPKTPFTLPPSLKSAQLFVTRRTRLRLIKADFKSWLVSSTQAPRPKIEALKNDVIMQMVTPEKKWIQKKNEGSTKLDGFRRSVVTVKSAWYIRKGIKKSRAS